MAFVQRNQVTTFDGTVAFDGAVAAGSTLFAVVSVNVPAEVSVTGITDNRGNTWVNDGRIETTGADGGVRELSIWRAINAAAGATTLTMAFAGASDTQRVWIGEFDDVGLTLDQYAENAPGSSTSPTSGATGTTTSAVELIIGAFTTEFNGHTFSGPGGAWTDRSEAADERVNVITQYSSGTGTFTATGTYSPAASYAAICATYSTAPAPTVDQAAFRFRNDDGDEDDATWIASQSADITRPAGQNVRLRTLLQGVEDPASAVYGLQYRRNAGAWLDAAPAVSFSAPTFGAIGTGSSGTTSCTPSYPSGITARSALFCVVTGRSNTATTAPAITGGGWTSVADLEGGTGTFAADTGTRRVTVFRKDTVAGTESGTITVTLAGNGNNTLRASILRVEIPAGHDLTVTAATGADSSNGTGYSAAMSSTLALAPSDLLLVCTAQNLDTGTASSRALSASGITFGSITNQRDDAVTNGFDHRHIINSVPVSTGTGTVTTTFSYTISANGSGPTAIVRLRMAVTPVALTLSPSANIAGSAATNTTQQLSGGTGSFAAGKISDDTTGVTVDIGDDGNTEVEWCTQAHATVVSDTDTLDFRVVRGGNALDSYSQTPTWTIGAGGVDASGSLVIPASTLAAAITVARTATAAMAIPHLQLAAAAAVARTAAGALTSTRPVLAASATVRRSASGALIVAPVSLAASADVERDAAAALTIPAQALAASTTTARTAAGALAPAPLALAASADVDRTVAGAADLPVPELEALAGQVHPAAGALTIPPTTLSADADVAREAAGALALSRPTLAAAASVARTVAGSLQLPAPALVATGVVSRTASGALVLSRPTLAASGTRVAFLSAAPTLPVPVLAAAVAVARFADGELVLAAPVLSAVASGEELVATAALALPMPVLDADALVTRTAIGTLQLRAPVLDADAFRLVEVDALLLLRAPELAAQAAIARLAAGALEVPALDLQAFSFVGALIPLLLTDAWVVSLMPARTVAPQGTRDVRSLMPSRTVEPL